MISSTTSPTGDHRKSRYGMIRLDFRLHEFSRITWVSDEARAHWEPRFQALQRTWMELEWRSVVEGWRRCAIVSLGASEWPSKARSFRSHQLVAMPLVAQPEDGGPVEAYQAVVGQPDAAFEFAEAWDREDDGAMSALLGTPTCCQKAYRTLLLQDRMIDGTWPMAFRTLDKKGTAESVLGIQAEPSTNTFWHALGLRGVPHLPCRFDCEATVALGAKVRSMARGTPLETGFEEILSILSWPVEWSCLHGIAETKTPILKLSTRTDATAKKHVVQWHGTQFPKEGATGLSFAFRRPKEKGTAAGVSGSGTSGLGAMKVAPSRKHQKETIMTRLEDSVVPRRVDGIHEKAYGDDVVVYFDKRKSGHTLNKSAAEIWRLCDGVRALEDIARHLEQKYGLPHHALRDDIDTTLQQLGASGLVSLDTTKRTVLAEAPTVRPEPPPKPAITPAPVASVESGDIDWSRMAEPQRDDYDIEKAIELLRRREGLDVEALRAEAVHKSPTVCGGRLAIKACYSRKHMGKDQIDAPFNHPHIGEALQYLRRWPAADRHFRRLMNTFHPTMRQGTPADRSTFLYGSFSHSLETMFGTMWASIHCPVMLAEAFVHELAHQKLFAIGIQKESCEALILNPRSEEFKSPAIPDRLRPMTAVVHGLYAFTYVTQLDTLLIPELVDVDADADRRNRLLMRLRRNVKRIRDGVEEVRANARVDAHGKAFLEDLYGWIDRVIEEGQAVLKRVMKDRHGYFLPAQEAPTPPTLESVAPKQESAKVTESAPPSAPARPKDDREPVRVFIGTEPRMRKAEIALEHSIRKHTSGPVQITWMDNWRGGIWSGWNIGRERGKISQHRQPGWTTEFSCFRYAIPEAAGFQGRAIYLDVDMLVLRDLRLVTELHMARPVLITPTCGAAILFDCSYFGDKTWWPRVEEMKPTGNNIDYYVRLLKEHDCISHMSAKWNCHDGRGYSPGKTGIIHFTRRNTQPWKPAPEVFDYQPHALPELESLWWDTYREACGEGPVKGHVKSHVKGTVTGAR